jgi:uncharacterized protein (DUF3820 family)
MTYDTLPFGKYKNTPIKEINDLPYLEWLFNQGRLDRPLSIRVLDRIKELRVN